MIYFGLVDWIFTVLLFLNWKRLRICVWCWSWLKFTWNRSCRVSDGRSGCIFRGSRGNFILEVEWEPCIVLFNHDTRQSCTKWQLDAHRCLITVPTNQRHDYTVHCCVRTNKKMYAECFAYRVPCLCGDQLSTTQCWGRWDVRPNAHPHCNQRFA